SCYRKYYSDYRNFLRRPKDVCKRVSRLLDSDEDLGVVSLDLTGFYDHITPSGVTTILKDLCVREGVRNDSVFWGSLNALFEWEWHRDDRRLCPSKMLFNGATLP